MPTAPVAPSPYEGMGPRLIAGKGWTFRVWAPFADSVSIVSDTGAAVALAREPAPKGAYWSVHLADVLPGWKYKYRLHNPSTNNTVEKIDPYVRLATGTGAGDFGIVHNPGQTDWSQDHFQIAAWNELVIYELHVGTFNDTAGGQPGNFDDVIAKLDHLQFLGINAVEVMPANEFMMDRSMGYNPSLLFAVEEAYNRSKVFQTLVKECHARGIAVIMDVVYNHFGPDDLGCCLWRFDDWSANDMGGIYFYNDWRAHTPYGEKNRPDFGRPEVFTFIRENALMWVKDYHCDGLRWDSTVNIRNVYGNNNDADHDLGAGWELMRLINDEMEKSFPGRLMIAEDLQGNEALTKESEFWGAGFGSQWDSAFASEIYRAVVPADDAARDMDAVCRALRRRFNGESCRRVIYSESHDEVKKYTEDGRLIELGRVPDKISWGDSGSWAARKRSTMAGALALTAPGIPMLFMGQEFLQWGSWDDGTPLDWSLRAKFQGIFKLYQRLIRLRRNQDFNTRGLTGEELSIFHVNQPGKVIAYHRWMYGGPGDDVIVVMNFSNQTYDAYNLGFPREGAWHLRFNSDWREYSGDFGDVGYDAVAVDGANPGMGGMPCKGDVGIGPYSVGIYSQ